MREATYPLAERQAVHTRAEYNYYQLLGLAGGGVCPASTVTGTAVRSYRTISPLPVSRRIGAIGCVFSVALSLGSPESGFAINRKTGAGPRWPLATTVPCPARTFLQLFLKPATARPTLFN